MNENPRPKKRKRKASAKDSTTVNLINNQNGSQQPAADAASPKTTSSDMDSLLQAQIAREEPNGLLGYIHNLEKKRKRYQKLPNGVYDGLQRFNEASKDHTVMPGYGAGLRAANGAPSPLTAGSQPPQNGWPQPASRDMQVEATAKFHNDGGQPAPLIDTLSKSKQRQIFGLISGIQGGIDHLQKQLNLLQACLGIELEGKDKKTI